MLLSLKYSFYNIVIFEIMYIAAVWLVFRPLASLTSATLIKASGYHVLLNADIASFLTGFLGLLTVLLLVLLAVVVVFYEYSVILILLKEGFRRRRVSLWFAMKKGLFSLNSLYSPSTLLFALFALGLIPFLHFVGLGATFLPAISIPKFITGEIARYNGGFIFNFLIQFLPLLILLKLVFVFPLMVFERLSFGESAKRSLKLIKGNSLNVALVCAFGVLCWFLPDLILHTFVKIETPVVNAVINLFIDIFQLLSMPIVLSAIFVCYVNVVGFPEDSAENSSFIDMGRLLWARLTPRFLKRRPAYLLVLLVVPVYLNSINYYEFKSPSLIIGHRGSLSGVENTVKAVLGSTKQKADYAEIDVMLTKDNVPIIMHDYNLIRLSGRMINIHETTASDLKKVEISQREMEDTIPTLDELCKAVKGKTKLLLELKPHGYETASLVDEVVKVLKANSMDIKKDVIFQTTDYDTLIELYEKYPDFYIGYVIVSGVGKMTPEALAEIPANFFNVESTVISKEIVEACHEIGREVFVWTVNDREIVGYLIDLQIDGIITDYPKEFRDEMDGLNFS